MDFRKFLRILFLEKKKKKTTTPALALALTQSLVVDCRNLIV